MRHSVGLIPRALAGLAATAVLLLLGAARATGLSYAIQPLARIGDSVGGVQTASSVHFYVGSLNDSGQVAVVVDAAAGGTALLEYDGRQFTPIAVPGQKAPGGAWTTAGSSGPNVNQQGDLAFLAGVVSGGQTVWSTFLWSAAARQVTPVTTPGMSLPGGLTLETGRTYPPRINNRGEIALGGLVKNAAGEDVDAVFFRGGDGKLQPIALPDQSLPGGGKVDDAVASSITDAGVVGFEATTSAAATQNNLYNGYTWQNGVITPIGLPNQPVPGSQGFDACLCVRLNDRDPTGLLDAWVFQGNTYPYGVLRWASGALTPVIMEGQPLPGGGTLKLVYDLISFPNEAGQYAFLAARADGSTAAYRIDPDNTLHLILESGTSSSLGTITQVGAGYLSFYRTSNGIGLNSKGQLALTVKLNGGPETLVLLTPG